MKIYITDWHSGGPLLAGTPYEHLTEIEGGPDEAFNAARELYDQGLNVMVLRVPAHNRGTKRQPDIVPEAMLVAVDKHKFQQR